MIDVDIEPPEVARQLPHRRDRGLGQGAVPLRPGGCLAVGKIEALDDIATLPAPVGRMLRAEERVTAGGHVAKPDARDRRRVDLRATY